MDEKRWKVGELAAQTGLTVRTLHHWDELGLLSPVERTPAGYRLYGEEEVRRLYRIVALRGLGLSLEEVGAALEDGELRELVRRQIEALDRRMEHDARLRRRLARVLESDDSSDLLATVEMMTMSERYCGSTRRARARPTRVSRSWLRAGRPSSSSSRAATPASCPRSSGCTARRAWSAPRAG